MKTIALLSSTHIANCDALPNIQNRTSAWLIIDHGDGNIEKHHMLSNACIKGFNAWLSAGYTAIDGESIWTEEITDNGGFKINPASNRRTVLYCY